MKLTDTQEKYLLAVIVAVLALVGSFVGVRVSPAPAANIPIGAEALTNQGIKCGAQTIGGGTPVPCVESDYSRGIAVYPNPATLTPVFSVNGATGDIYTGGSVSLGGSYVGITPVATATAITLYQHNETANRYWKCFNANITNSATLTPVAGATVVGQPLAGLSAVTGDAARSAAIYAAGVITVSVYNSALTPAANTTPAAVQTCYEYSK